MRGDRFDCRGRRPLTEEEKQLRAIRMRNMDIALAESAVRKVEKRISELKEDIDRAKYTETRIFLREKLVQLQKQLESAEFKLFRLNRHKID
jgi:hypothetical protein